MKVKVGKLLALSCRSLQVGIREKNGTGVN